MLDGADRLSNYHPQMSIRIFVLTMKDCQKGPSHPHSVWKAGQARQLDERQSPILHLNFDKPRHIYLVPQKKMWSQSPQARGNFGIKMSSISMRTVQNIGSGADFSPRITFCLDRFYFPLPCPSEMRCTWWVKPERDLLLGQLLLQMCGQGIEGFS